MSLHRTGRRTAFVHLLAVAAVLFAVFAPGAAFAAPSVTLDPTPATVGVGQRITLTGRATSVPDGARVVAQRLSAGKWRTLTEGTIQSAGRYRLRVTPTAAGAVTYRVVVPGGPGHVKTASGRRVVKVRAFAFPIVPASAARYPADHHDYPAVDIFAACGTRVVSPTGGRVDEVSRVDRWDPKVNAGPTRGGLFVSIVGNDGARYYLSHFETIEAAITRGTRVYAGQRLGTVGRTGSARPTPCHIHLGISPPCGTGDWAVRRGVIWPQPYLDAWKAGTDRSAGAAVAKWAATNPARCPGVR